MGGWRLDDVDGLTLARCEALEALTGLAHAFSTRQAHGGDAFDLGPAEGESDAVLRRRREFARAAGFGSNPLAILRQVHGRRVVSVDDLSARPPDADGVVRLAGGRSRAIPAVRTADCVALLIAETRTGAVAAVHAGWRGVAAGIAQEAVGDLVAAGGAPGNLVVGLGPAVLGCCYEVGDDVAAAIVAACPPGRFQPGRSAQGRATVDLHAALAAQLEAVGVRAGAIHRAPWCTKCRSDLFYSVRAEGAAAGRLMAAIGPEGSP